MMAVPPLVLRPYKNSKLVLAMILLGQQGPLLSSHSINILQTKFVEHYWGMNSTVNRSGPLPWLRLYQGPCGWCWKSHAAAVLLPDVWACMCELWETPNQKPLLPQWVTPHSLTPFSCLPSSLKFHLMQCSHCPAQPTARYSPVHPTFTKLKPAQSSVTGAEANVDAVLGNTQLGSSCVTGLSNRVQQTILSAFDSRSSRWWTASSSLMGCHSHRSLRELSVAEVHPSASVDEEDV